MSTIKTTNLQHPSAASPNLVLAADGSVSGGAGLGGLVHINTTTFSAVSSVSLDNVFTSDYENYAIILRALGSVEYTGRGRLRAAGTDNTTANSYILQFVRGISTAASASNNVNNLWDSFFYGDATAGVARYDFYRPNVAATTFFTGSFFARNDYVQSVGGYHTQATSYDGITFIASTGTITGTISVYGYSNGA